MAPIAVINQKGGVGKTTTVANLGTALAIRKQRVLLIDMDPQAHLTIHLGVDPRQFDQNVYTLLTQQHALDQALHRLNDSLWLAPSHIDLAGAETELINVIGRETLLRDALAGASHNYDYVLIDCPPSLGVLTLNALCAADEVLIPMQSHFLALQGVSQLLETVQIVQARVNPGLKVGGVVLCMHDSSTRLGGEILADLRRFFAEHRHGNRPWADARIYDAFIRRNIKLAESPSHGRSVFDYAPKSHGASDYLNLADELMDVHHKKIQPIHRAHDTNLAPSDPTLARSA